MRAFIVCVEFNDLLSVTLPYNRHHFDEVIVATSERADRTISVCQANDATVFATESWWDNMAAFDKWKGLEQCLDRHGRHGEICLMDADILWPKDVGVFRARNNHLYTPHRRIMRNHLRPIPPESEWKLFPRAYENEAFAGYSQVFKGTDCHVQAAPWFYGLDDCHGTAGFADIHFQARWPASKRFRPPWECLHLGIPMQNWCGRVSRALSGKTPPRAEERKAELQRRLRNVLTIPARFKR